ncbi:MAG: DUF1343 domain-containing protein [Phaeodactylibacter sp.]|nr:DUF1343 domain-containing protein [Phaeodactylibacter sp.]MCB9050085.1 DUF1343 domain-containing protein [Lewinellaceae bacterium]
MVVKLKIFVAILVLFQLNCGSLSKKVVEQSPAAPEGQVSEPVPEASEPLEKATDVAEEPLRAEEPVVVQEKAEPLPPEEAGPHDSPKVGAAQLGLYLPELLQSQGVALLVNQTSMVGNTHLVDTLLSLGVKVSRIFAPEHGFRGSADAGEKVRDGKDLQTGISIVSLYGSRRKPTAEDLKNTDVVVFDVQDVGARFYTYISSMHYVMEACAEQGVRFLVLDRPNPNGHYIDGPILDEDYQSFVGMHPVPVVHGMTVGEYAQMINGEGWLAGGIKCELTVVPCAGYTHATPYELPVPPSPNLPNMRAIYLYPSTCFFEGTVASEGRGTSHQFQVYGHPDYPEGDYTFTPVPMPGARYPKLEGLLCRGYSLADKAPDSIRAEARINLSYLIEFYRNFPDKGNFFLENLFFDKLAGGAELRQQIIAGKTEGEIRQGWQEGLDLFRKKRRKYLLYEDAK